MKIMMIMNNKEIIMMKDYDSIRIFLPKKIVKESIVPTPRINLSLPAFGEGTQLEVKQA